jgi:hypothetical protein
MGCTTEVNQRNAERAKKERPGVKFGSVDVTYVASDGETITFETRGTDEQNHSFTLPWSAVWSECPSTVAKENPRGKIYLSREGLKVEASGAPGVRIKGSVPDDNPAILIKWPDSGAIGPRAPLEIWPTNVVVTGYAHGDPELEGTVSLMDLSLCDLAQDIQLDNGGMITLSLTAAGFAAFGVPMEEEIDDLRRAVELVGNVKAVQPPSALELSRAVVLIDRWSRMMGKGAVPASIRGKVGQLLATANQPAYPQSLQGLQGLGQTAQPETNDGNGLAK